mgnify:CR=1 FL=1
MELSHNHKSRLLAYFDGQGFERWSAIYGDAEVSRIRRTIRDNTTPRHVPARVVQVTDIPRTKSGKIVELAVRAVVHGEPVKNVEALANPAALEQFRARPELQS